MAAVTTSHHCHVWLPVVGGVLMHIGFTGSRNGLFPYQSSILTDMLAYYRLTGYTHLHHGDCVGADAQAAGIAQYWGYLLIAHPPVNPRYRAFIPSHEVRPEQPYHVRNDAIVAACDLGIACPANEAPDGVTSRGTWSVVAKLSTARRPAWIITPTRTVPLTAPVREVSASREYGAFWPEV